MVPALNNAKNLLHDKWKPVVVHASIYDDGEWTDDAENTIVLLVSFEHLPEPESAQRQDYVRLKQDSCAEKADEKADWVNRLENTAAHDAVIEH